MADLPTLDRDGARKLLKTTASDLWAQQRGPILGSQLRTAMDRRTQTEGNRLDLRTIGFDSFGQFLRSEPDIVAVQPRPGTDILVAPAENAASLLGTKSTNVLRQKIRPDFWRAFVAFPILNEKRGYDPMKDVIYFSEQLPEHAIAINPIARDEQLRIRQEFLQSLTDEEALKTVHLDSGSGFSKFTEILMTNPHVRHRWIPVWVSFVTSKIGEWARTNGVVGEVWLPHPSPRHTYAAVGVTGRMAQTAHRACARGFTPRWIGFLPSDSCKSAFPCRGWWLQLKTIHRNDSRSGSRTSSRSSQDPAT